MDSGPLLEGGGDGFLEKRQWVVCKVYSRKNHNRDPKTNLNQISQAPPETQPLSSSQTLVTTTDDVNSSLQQLLLPLQGIHWPPVPRLQSSAASVDDACSLNHKPCANHSKANCESRFIKINLISKTKREAREWHRRLTTELQLVRSLLRKIETKKLEVSLNDGLKTTPAMGRIKSLLSANDVGVSFPTRKELAISQATLAAVPFPSCRQLSVLVPVGSGQDFVIGDAIERDKRAPKANQLYKNTDFLLGKEKFPPQEYNKKSKANVNKNSLQSMQNKFYEHAFNKCGVLLSKLIKHNHGWVFNSPVDADALGLPDYHRIIKHPMDLGTVALRLSSNWYRAPMEFAQDVRLTFHNAMTYNPKGQDVHLMAEQLLQMFEERWPIIEADLAYFHSPSSMKGLPPLDMKKTFDRLDSTVHHSAGDLKIQSNQVAYIRRPQALTKPKAKDPNKRDMTKDEKQRLSNNLQKLPLEKLDIVVQIIRKRNFSLNQHEDEIEVDIDTVDTETLWELDRFLTNYKKNLSKIKRKEALAIQARAEAEPCAEHNEKKIVCDAASSGSMKRKKTVAKANASSPVGARIGERASRSSSSSSSSSDSGSTSTDSDSENSSGNGSDPAHPPAT